MNDRQFIYLAMAWVVYECITSRKTIYEPNYPELFDSATLLRTLLDSAGVQGAIFSSVAQGKTEAKNNSKDEMCDSFDVLSGALQSWATKNNKPEVFKVAEFNSQDKKKRPLELYNHLKPILELAGANLVALQGYGLLALDIQTAEMQLEAFRTANNIKDESFEKRSAALLEVEEIIKKIRTRLEKDLDRQMKIFKKKDSAFYNEYLGAREQKNLGVRHEKDDERAEEGQPVNQ